MADNTETTNIPQSWDELTKQAGMAGIPGLKKPESLTPSESALFEVTRSRVAERLDKLRESGAFDGKADPVETSITLAELVEYADMFYRTLAADEESWDAWTAGRTVYDLTNVYTTLTGYYAQALGKSSESRNAAAKLG